MVLPPFENDNLFSWIWDFLGKFVYFYVNVNCTLTQVRQFLPKRIQQNSAKRLKSKQTLLSLPRKYLHKYYFYQRNWQKFTRKEGFYRYKQYTIGKLSSWSIFWDREFFQVDFPLDARPWDCHFQTEVIIFKFHS